MPDITQWFTLETLQTPQGAALAVWMLVEVGKKEFDRLYHSYTGKRPRTLVVALVVAYAILYGTSALNGSLDARTAFENVFNGFVATVMAGLPSILPKATGKGEDQSTTR